MTYLALIQLSLDGGLLLITAEFSVDGIDLISQLVNESLKLVLLVLGISDELVLHEHSVLALSEGLLDGGLEGPGAVGDGEIALADLLLDLAGLDGLLGGVFGVGVDDLFVRRWWVRYEHVANTGENFAGFGCG